MWHSLTFVIAGTLVLAFMSTVGRAQQPAESRALPSHLRTPSSGSTSSAPLKAALSASALRQAATTALRHAASAKEKDFAPAVKALVEVYRGLGRDILLPQNERLRLGVQVRTRLARFANQFRYQMAHGTRAAANAAYYGSSNSTAGSAGAPAVDGLNSLNELIQSTISGPGDWAAPQQQAGNGQAFAGGGAGFGGAGFGAAGNAGGGAFGDPNALAQGAAANGADLVDLIQKTVDPPSWDINGGPGSIVYFNNFRALVVRQTGDAQDDVGGLLGQMRK
jgi:hypothetical protein